MLTRKPVAGDVLEISNLFGGWSYWGIVDHVDGTMVYCQKRGGFVWCFGRNGCLGNNVAFRIVNLMDDPMFN